jgi:hypothetical protein
MESRIRFIAIAVFAFLLLLSCSTTQTTNTWVSPSYRGSPVSNVFVIAVTKNKDLRRSFENKFVQQLKATGVRAFPSSSEMKLDQKIEKEAVLAIVEKLGADSVLVTHLVSMEEKETRTPSATSTQDRPDDYHGGTYYESVAQAYDTSAGAQYNPTRVKVRLESKLYEVKTEKPIWSSQSKTIDPQSTMELFDSAIAAFIRNLQQNKLLP